MHYIKNAFLMEDEGSMSTWGQHGGCVFNDNDVYQALVQIQAGKNPGVDIGTLRKVISFLHEGNHFIQDMSIYGCIVKGDFQDEMAELVRILSHNQGLTIPFLGKDNCNYEKNLAKCNLEEKKALKQLFEIKRVYSLLFCEWHQKPKIQEYAFESKNEEIIEAWPVCFQDLIESYASQKAYFDIFRIYPQGNLAAQLHTLVEEDDVYPFEYVQGRIEWDHDQMNYRRQYHVVNFIMLAVIPLWLNKVEYEYFRKKIPIDYKGSNVELWQSCFRVILETALNIPSKTFILRKYRENGQSDVFLQKFSPVHRFFMILKAVRKHNGFPNSVNGESFFVTFYNWVAQQFDWPNFREVTKSIEEDLSERLRYGGEVITGLRLRAVDCKSQNFGRLASASVLDVMKMLNMPLFVTSKNGLEVKYFVGNFEYNPTGLLTIYNLFFRQSGIKKFQPLCDTDKVQDQVQKTFDNNLAFAQEAVNRAFSFATLTYYCMNGIFCCPFSNNGCPHGTFSTCSKFTEFKTACVNCEKRISRSHHCQIVPSDAYSNTWDCMFYNYLLDNDYELGGC